jgi:hypothetical protein
MVRYRGRDQIELGYLKYTEDQYGSSPGATPSTLFRVGHVRELTPLYDPELNRIHVLRDTADSAALAILSRRENVGLRVQWLQGNLAQYWQARMFLGENFFAEAMIKRGTDELYLFWTGLKCDMLTARCSIGEPIVWEAELVGKTYDNKNSTIHSYGASPGDPHEWDDSYVQVSENDSDWSIVPEVTDWEFRIDNRLKANYTFNETGSKQLKSLEEMEPILTARLTMNLTSDTYLDYLLNGTELYLKLVLPDSKWLKFNKGKFATVEPVLKPEDLIACRVQFEGRFLTTSWD